MQIITSDRIRETKHPMVLIVNDATGSQVAFTLTGSVHVLAIWAVVTTVISSNHTAGYLQLNDQTATPDITLAAGVTLSSFKAGSLIYKEGLTAAALEIHSNATATFEEPASAGQPSFSPFTIVKKTAVTTTIDYTYTTTNTPATGVLEWHALWMPLSPDGALDGVVVPPNRLQRYF